MSLSVVCLVHYSPERAAAMLAPLRALDPEIILAVDDRIDPEWIEGYREHADHVITIRFPGMFSKTATWITHQCTRDWILILHDDELPSAGMAGEIAEIMAAGEVTHAWVRRWWLYPDSGQWIDEWPWRPDYHLRLIRNDQRLFRIPAMAHEAPRAIGPHVFMRAPLYHASLMFEDLDDRVSKCERYDKLRPGLTSDGLPMNQAYLLPEQRATPPRLAPVPEGDLPLVRAFLGEGEPTAPPRSALGSLRHASSDEIATFDESRELPESAYRARIRSLVDSFQMVDGHPRTFDLEVTNLSDEAWPGGVDARPEIRIAYRWIDQDGAGVEGLRTPFGKPVGPRESAIVPMLVQPPGSPGIHTIEIDVVHEHVRWFDCVLRADVAVRPQQAD